MIGLLEQLTTLELAIVCSTTTAICGIVCATAASIVRMRATSKGTQR